MPNNQNRNTEQSNSKKKIIIPIVISATILGAGIGGFNYMLKDDSENVDNSITQTENNEPDEVVRVDDEDDFDFDFDEDGNEDDDNNNDDVVIERDEDGRISFGKNKDRDSINIGSKDNSDKGKSSGSKYRHLKDTVAQIGKDNKDSKTAYKDGKFVADKDDKDKGSGSFGDLVASNDDKDKGSSSGGSDKDKDDNTNDGSKDDSSSSQSGSTGTGNDDNQSGGNDDGQGGSSSSGNSGGKDPKPEPEKPDPKPDPEPKPEKPDPKPDPEPEPEKPDPKPDPEPEPKPEVDKAELTAIIKTADKLNKDRFTKGTWEKVDTALKQAKKVNSDKSSTKRQVDRAINNLEKAMNELKVKSPTIEVVGLEDLDSGNVTNESTLDLMVEGKDVDGKTLKPKVTLNGKTVKAKDGIYTLNFKEGSNDLVVKVADEFGGYIDVSYEINYVKDDVGEVNDPTIEVKGFNNDNIDKDGNLTFTVDAKDGKGKSIKPTSVKLNGKDVKFDSNEITVKLKEGENTIDIYVKDKYGGEDKFSGEVTYKPETEGGNEGEEDGEGELKTPTVEYDGISSENITKDGKLTFSVKAFDGKGKERVPTVKHNDERVDVDEDGNVTVQLVKGENNFLIELEDKYGGSVKKENTLTYDPDKENIDPPTISYEKVTIDDVTEDGELTFKVEAEDGKGKKITPTVKLNGEEVDVKSNKVTIQLKEGTNLVEIDVEDEYGGKSHSEFTIDYNSKGDGNEGEEDLDEPEVKVEGIELENIDEDGNLTFTVGAKDSKGKDVKPTVTHNGKKVDFKSSEVTIKVVKGDNEIKIEYEDDYSSASKSYTFKYDPSGNEDGEVVEKTNPVIDVSGLTNKNIEEDGTLTFSVEATDNDGEDIKPTITLNGKDVKFDSADEITVKLKEGENTIVIEAVDEDGRKTTRSHTVTYVVDDGGEEIEVEPPYLDASEIVTNKVDGNTLKFTIESYDVDGDELKPTIIHNGKEVKYTYPNVTIELVEGDNDINVYVEDKYGGKVTKSYYIDHESETEGDGEIEDMDPPEVEIIGFEEKNITKDGQLTFTVNAKDGKGRDIVPEVTHNEKEVKPDKNGKYTVTLIEGSNEVKVNVVDALGQFRSSTAHIDYEPVSSGGEEVNTLPTIYVNGLDEGNIENSTGKINFTATAKDSNGKTLPVKVTFQNAFESSIVDNSNSGDYSFDLRQGVSGVLIEAVDEHGNIGYEVYEFKYNYSDLIGDNKEERISPIGNSGKEFVVQREGEIWAERVWNDPKSKWYDYSSWHGDVVFYGYYDKDGNFKETKRMYTIEFHE